MTNFFVSTDSTCDLYANEIEKMGIGYLPLTITIEENGETRFMQDKFQTYDEYVKVLFDELYYPDDTWTRGGTEALDKNTNFDGVDCVVWTKETSDHSYTSWIGVDDGVLYYNEDVITIDGESATSTYRLVTCTFIDKL